MSALTVVRYADAQVFLAEAGEYLAAREAEHNLLLGLAGRLVTQPNLYGEEPRYLASVTASGRIVGVAMRTPPFGLVLSELDDEAAVEAIATDAQAMYRILPGVLGPVEAARRFAELWSAAVGCTAHRLTAERIYATSAVSAPIGVPGRMRKARAPDRALLVDWMGAFLDEARRLPRIVERSVDDFLSREGDFGAYLWEDGDQPVSFAAGGNPTPNGARVGPVYTPPALRGRGYASALTAALTQRLLAGGRRYCFLFTDLANPTSNRIYQRIGYRAVTDVDEYRFD